MVRFPVRAIALLYCCCYTCILLLCCGKVSHGTVCLWSGHRVYKVRQKKVAEKSVGGDVKKSITSSFFNRITFHLAVRCRTFQKI